MSDLKQVAGDIEVQLRAGLGGLVPDASEKQWIADLAVDLAAEQIRFACATSEAQRTQVADNLDVLNATWKLRLAEKELMAQNVVGRILQMALTTAVTCCFPQGAAIGVLAKFVVGKVVNRGNLTNPNA